MGGVDGSDGNGLVKIFFFDEVAYQKVSEFCRGDGEGTIDLGVEPVGKVEECIKGGLVSPNQRGSGFEASAVDHHVKVSGKALETLH